MKGLGWGEVRKGTVGRYLSGRAVLAGEAVRYVSRPESDEEAESIEVSWGDMQTGFLYGGRAHKEKDGF